MKKYANAFKIPTFCLATHSFAQSSLVKFLSRRSLSYFFPPAVKDTTPAAIRASQTGFLEEELRSNLQRSPTRNSRKETLGLDSWSDKAQVNTVLCLPRRKLLCLISKIHHGKILTRRSFKEMQANIKILISSPNL